MATHRMWATDKKGNWWLFECPLCGHVVEVDFTTGKHKEIVPAPNLYDRHTAATTPDFSIGEMEIRAD